MRLYAVIRKIMPGLCLLIYLVSPADLAANNPSAHYLNKSGAGGIFKETEVFFLSVIAVSFYLSGADRAVAEWACRENPLFGSPDRALKMSDILADSLNVLNFVSAAYTSHHGDRFELKYIFEPFISEGSGLMLVDFIKSRSSRRRPDNTDYLSFPSAHSFRAGLHSSSTYRNLNTVKKSRVMRGGLIAAGFLCGWARIEGGKHHPSDIIAGHLIGYSVSRVFRKIFGIGAVYEPGRLNFRF